LLVTMGGSDPAGLTLQAVRALELLDSEFETTVVLGPGFAHHDALNHLLGRTQRRFLLRQALSDFPSVMARADLALCSFGVTAYELAAAGVPAIYLCLTPDHAESASALAEAGMGVSLGVFRTVTDNQLAATVRELLEDRSQRERMRNRARQCVDGLGAARVANALANHLSWAAPAQRQ
jgi:spore coat polysaccharide biosynthesis predicted glycosyltransferase SpsG